MSVGIPTVPAPPVAALTTAHRGREPGGSAGADRRCGQQPGLGHHRRVVGYGGGGGAADEPQNNQSPNDKDRRSDENYNRNSAVQVIGYGGLTNNEASRLTQEERQKLSR